MDIVRSLNTAPAVGTRRGVGRADVETKSTSDDTVAAIRAALDAISKEWRTFGVGDEYETTGYLKIGEFVVDIEDIGYDNAEFIEQSPDWLRYLLSEHGRLSAIADAARAFLTPDLVEGMSAARMDWCEDAEQYARFEALVTAARTLNGEG